MTMADGDDRLSPLRKSREMGQQLGALVRWRKGAGGWSRARRRGGRGVGMMARMRGVERCSKM